MKKTRGLSLKAQKIKWGIIFVSPWIVGFLIFFLTPLIQSVTFSFSKVNVTDGAVLTEFTGLTNWKYVLYENADYTTNLGEALSSFFTTLPIILVLSLCIALVLNQEFRGRLFARALFFIPALMAGSMVMSLFSQSIMSSATLEVSGGAGTYFDNAVDFEAIIMGLGLPESVTSLLATYMSSTSMLIWNCGVQIILFLSGLQSIPRPLYEVARVEGATSWETFWFVTFPMLTNIVLLTAVYTTIDLFTNADNPVMRQAYQQVLEKQNYSDGSAMLWIYFSIVGVVLVLLFALMNKLFVKKWSAE